MLEIDNESISIIIVCPQCENLFLSYRYHGFVVDPQIIKKLMEEGDKEKFNTYVRRVIAEDNYVGKFYSPKKIKENSDWVPSGRPEENPELISDDDISNLRIDLGRISSAQEIIDLINRY